MFQGRGQRLARGVAPWARSRLAGRRREVMWNWRLPGRCCVLDVLGSRPRSTPARGVASDQACADGDRARAGCSLSGRRGSAFLLALVASAIRTNEGKPTNCLPNWVRMIPKRPSLTMNLSLLTMNLSLESAWWRGEAGFRDRVQQLFALADPVAYRVTQGHAPALEFGLRPIANH